MMWTRLPSQIIIHCDQALFRVSDGNALLLSAGPANARCVTPVYVDIAATVIPCDPSRGIWSFLLVTAVKRYGPCLWLCGRLAGHRITAEFRFHEEDWDAETLAVYRNITTAAVVCGSQLGCPSVPVTAASLDSSRVTPSNSRVSSLFERVAQTRSVATPSFQVEVGRSKQRLERLAYANTLR